MRAEVELRRIAFCCAVFLLFGMAAPRTSWHHGNANRGATVIDSPGWNAVATLSGVLALAFLAAGARSRRALLALCAAAAFAFAAYVAGSYALALSRGEAVLEEFPVTGPGWTVRPTPAPPFFALAALVGAIASLALAASWLRQPSGDAAPRVPFG